MPELLSVPVPKTVYRVSTVPSVFTYRVRGSGPVWRWDDPLDQYGVLYTAESRTAAFVEYFGDLRPSTGMLAAMRQIRHDQPGLHETTVQSGQLLASDLHHIFIGEALLDEAAAIDVTAAESVQALHLVLAQELTNAGIADLGVAVIQGRDYQVTQTISRFAYEDSNGFASIRCPSYYGNNLICWSFFEGEKAQLSLRAPARPQIITAVDPDDIELRRALDILNIQLV